MLYATIIIAAGTLAANNSSIRHNCAISPNGGSEHRWGITLTQDSRDSFIDSGCPIHRYPPRTSGYPHVLPLGYPLWVPLRSSRGTPPIAYGFRELPRAS